MHTWLAAIDRLEREPRKNWQDVVAVLRGLTAVLDETVARLQAVEAALAAHRPPDAD
jgi:hypothetical protein